MWRVGGRHKDNGGTFVEVCKRRDLKFNAGKSKVIMLGGEEGLECEVCVDGMRLEHVSEFKYLGYVLEESGIDEADCRRKVASGRRVGGTIRSLVNTKGLKLDCAKVLRESLLMPFFIYSSETMIWRENERSRIRNLKMEDLRGLLGISRMDKVPNAQLRELCGVMKGLEERIDEGLLRWFDHMERRRIKGLLRGSM